MLKKIPAGSAIITKKNGLATKAVDALKKGDDSKVESIIKKMPMDKGSKKADGTSSIYDRRKIRTSRAAIKQIGLPDLLPNGTLEGDQQMLNSRTPIKPLITNTPIVNRTLQQAPVNTRTGIDPSIEEPTKPPTYKDVFKGGVPPVSPLTATLIGQTFIPSPRAPLAQVHLSKMGRQNTLEQELQENERQRKTRLAYQAGYLRDGSQIAANSSAISADTMRANSGAVQRQSELNNQTAARNTQIENQERTYNANGKYTQQMTQQQINAGKLGLAQDAADNFSADLENNQRIYESRLRDHNLSEAEKRRLKMILSAYEMYGRNSDGDVTFKQSTQ